MNRKAPPPSTGHSPTIRSELQLDDKKLVPLLCGDFDRHLEQIEKALAIKIRSRGNVLTLSGDAEAVGQAEQVLASLWRELKNTGSLEARDVEAALRFARQPMTVSLSQDTPLKNRKKNIMPRSPGQAAYLEALRRHDMVFGLGPAGTGKTYLAVAQAVSMLQAGRVDRLILTRPAVEAGERLGFLPGDLKDKIDPYLRPLYDALHDMMPPEQIERSLEHGEIEIAPLAFMRGRTLANAYVILDEAQNTTPMQMKMFLTRLGEQSRMAITGDLSQIDLPPGQQSGLAEAYALLHKTDGITFVELTTADVVRHPLVARVVQAYDNAKKKSR